MFTKFKDYLLTPTNNSKQKAVIYPSVPELPIDQSLWMKNKYVLFGHDL